LLLCAAGCGGSQPAAADPQQARNTLVQVLDAWKNGETADSLKQLDPAVHANDPDWRANKQLLKYEIGSEHAHGNSWSCQVVLTIQDSTGSKRDQQVSYTIDTAPELVVVRDIIE
jgi:hypothetical protein